MRTDEIKGQGMEHTIKLEANAKINLGLDVLGVREDGYHLVKMVMQSLKLADEVTIEVTGGLKDQDTKRSNQTEAQDYINNIVIKTDSTLIPCDGSNLCFKAAKLMKAEYGIKEALTVTLQKRIPVAAGLAGGSADAAAVIIGMNELFQLGLSQKELMEQGVKIGADVPFCIMKGTALSEGIGEQLTGLKNLPKCGIILFKPKIDVSTKTVYKKLDGIEIKTHPDIDGMLAAIEGGDLKKVVGFMGNVLELVTENDYPVIRDIKNKLKDYGALGAMMSGSGPTVFGIFEDMGRAKDCYARLKSDGLEGQLILTEPLQTRV